MDFLAVVDQVIALLRQRGRITYGALQLQCGLTDAQLEVLKDELLHAQQVARDEDGRVLVWTGDAETLPALQPPAKPTSHAATPPAPSPPPEAERRQLTVLFCDLVDSTVLASQLDPEDLREVVRAYQETCAKVIARFDGHIAQYLGDGLLVYFGYPLAHEDDAQRAVRAGLGMIEALGQLNTRLAQERGVQLAVRLGCHTGLVVVGEVGGSTRQEQLVLGETPNLAARLQGLASPNTVVISAVTLQLLGGFFAYHALGTSLLKGLAQPIEVYQVLHERMARSRLEAVGSSGLTPLVGREQEIGLLRERWTQVKEGLGQVVLLSGEAGIGKSRLVQVLTEQAASEPQGFCRKVRFLGKIQKFGVRNSMTYRLPNSRKSNFATEPSSLRIVLRQQLGLGRDRLGKLGFEHLRNLPVVLLARALEQRLIGHVLDQRVLEEIRRLGRQPPLVQQLRHHQLVQPLLHGLRVPRGNGLEQG